MRDSRQLTRETTAPTNTIQTNFKQQQQHHNQPQLQLQQQAVDIEAADYQTGSGSTTSPSNAPSKQSIADSIQSSEQVVTSLQVNSKTATATDGAPEPANKLVLAEQQTLLVPPPLPQAPLNSQANQVAYVKKRKPKRVLDPSGSLCYHWSMVVSFAFLYNFWSLSYRFAFREIDFDTMAAWFALDYSADFIYLMDIIINSRTGYLEDGVLQKNVAKVRHHYGESTRFYLDGLCLLPLDVLYLSFGFNSILRCTRLVKIYKFWHYVDRTERHTNYPNIFRTFTLVHYILVIFHWNACLFHMISKSKIIDLESMYAIEDSRCNDILCQYLHAFYWSTLTLTLFGDIPKPRTKGEFIYVIVELIFGLFLFATVLGHVANIVTNVSAARKEFQAKLDAVKTFMRMRRVSDELQNKVIRWFDYLWISQQSSDEDRSVACLPDRLKAEIAIHVHLDTLKRVDIFQNTEAGFLCELVLRLKPVLFSPGDYVCRKNEVGHEMYIVSRGILEVVTDEGKVVVATLKAGSYFGEISVLNVGLAGNKRTASVRSVGYSDLFCLNKQDLWDVLKNYPNAEARIRARAEERLSKLDIDKQRGPSGNATIAPAATGCQARHRPSKSNSRSQQQHCPDRKLQSISCGCFVANHNPNATAPATGKGFSTLSNNGRPTTECVCRKCMSSREQKLAARLRMPPPPPLVGCHKSRASTNGSPRMPTGCFVDRKHDDDYDDDDNDQPELELTPGCRLANCHRHGHRCRTVHHSRQPVSYSRSFDQAAKARQRHQRQQQRQQQREQSQQDDSDGAEFSEDSSPADNENKQLIPPPAPPASNGTTSDRQSAEYRARLNRRSSSAEPPIDADSRRQLARLAKINSSSQRRNRQQGAARRGQTNSCSVSIDEPETSCGSCIRQAGTNRNHSREGWAASQVIAGQPPAGYWILQPPQWPGSNQMQTLIQLPEPSSMTISPDSQQQSTASPAASAAIRAQSASTMYLNLHHHQQPLTPLNLIPPHQAALLSPALIPSNQPSPMYFSSCSPTRTTASRGPPADPNPDPAPASTEDRDGDEHGVGDGDDGVETEKETCESGTEVADGAQAADMEDDWQRDKEPDRDWDTTEGRAPI